MKSLDLITLAKKKKKNEHQLINYTEIMILTIFQNSSTANFQFMFNFVTSSMVR